MVETPACIKLFNPTQERLSMAISPLLRDRYDVLIRKRDVDILICPVQKEKDVFIMK